MTFGGILPGQSLFIDANIFVYALAPEPHLGPPCFQLLERIRRKEVEGFTSAHVLSETSHRLMSLEACSTCGCPYAGIANRLKRHAADIAKLHKFRQALDEIRALGMHILPITANNILTAGDLSCHHGLLSGDALLLTMMQSQGLTLLASHDNDFDRVPGITRCGPV